MADRYPSRLLIQRTLIAAVALLLTVPAGRATAQDCLDYAAAGVYLLRLEAGPARATGSVVLVR